MFINHSSREVTAKVVYYGPGLSGKTTNLQYVFSVTNPNARGELISIETEIERTLFFDLLPMNVGSIGGYQTKFQLYTVPGQVFYDSTRKLVLKGADGIVFVADSQELMMRSNLDSLENLLTNLSIHKIDIDEIPIVFQYNKRDLNSIMPEEDLNVMLNKFGAPFYSAVATDGTGVVETLRGISTLIIKKIKSLLNNTNDEAEEDTPAVAFNIDPKHKIIDKESLPFKKIHTNNLENESEKMVPGDQEVNLTPLENIKLEQDIHEVELRVETVEEINNDFRDLEGILMSDEDDEDDILPLEGLEEIQLEDSADIDIAAEERARTVSVMEIEENGSPEDGFDLSEVASENNFLQHETHRTDDEDTGDAAIELDTVELTKRKFKGLDEPDTHVAPNPDTNKMEVFPGLDDENEVFPSDSEHMKELDDINLDNDFKFPEILEEDSVEISGPETESEKIQTPQPHQPSQPPQPEPQIDRNDSTVVMTEPAQIKNLRESLNDSNKKTNGTSRRAEPSEKIKEIEELKNSLKNDKPVKKTPKMNEPALGMELFNRFKDKTRVTVIKEVRINDNQFFIELKDQHNNLLDTFQVNITPETKKVTLILDVKK
jgi:mutual gliding-motility protein MglA